MFNLEATPYLLTDTAAAEVQKRLVAIEDRVAILRRSGTLTADTLRDYYGEKRFDQVAESNALEGSTLSVGETELAVLKGITITGHDPAFIRDAIALDRALGRIAELAKHPAHITDIAQLHEIHGLLLGERAGAGIFRKERVTIRGAQHTPPKTWEQVMKQMTEWQTWSADSAALPAPIRAAVIHAWLTHIHPYIDGNGRTARAMGNLELIRAGYPPIIIKKKERDRYIEALAESDEGGDIRSFFELVFDRLEGSLTGLESSAKRKQGYNPLLEKIRTQQRKQLTIWDTSVKLLSSIVEHQVSQALEGVDGACNSRQFADALDLDDYITVCSGYNVPRSWAFQIRLDIPGLPSLERLAYIGHRSNPMRQHLGEGGPSLFWAHKNPDGLPRWLNDGPLSPYAVEITTRAGNGDEWFARRNDGSIVRISTTDLASRISEALVKIVSGD